MLRILLWIAPLVPAVSQAAIAQHQDHEHAAPAERPLARLAYIANAGVSVSTSEIGVLIDVLFRDGQEPFARVAQGTIQHIETAGQPFDEVRAVMVTNHKPDHFDAKSVSRFLHHNRETVLLAPPQVITDLREHGTEVDKFAARIREADPKPGEKITVELPDMKIDVLRLSHDPIDGRPVENFGYIVHLSDKRVLHVGDAKFDEITRAALLTHATGMDMACVPYWWIQEESSRSFLRDELSAKTVAALHVPPDQAGTMEADLRSKLERVLVLVRPFASRRL